MGNRSFAVGVDIGGTNLRAARIDRAGKILKKGSRAVGGSRELKPFFKNLAALIRETMEGEDTPAGIALGVPGICDQVAGVVYQLPHYPEWRDVPILDMLKREFSVPVFFDNDANMAAVGEHWLGAAKDVPTFWMLTLGTGIGGGLFLDGKLWRGVGGFAGEVGHMKIVRDGRSCACGGKGCWETYAASQTLPRGESLESMGHRADRGEREAKEFWREFGESLGLGISNLVHVTDAEFYVLSGGIVGSLSHFLDPCLDTVRGNVYGVLQNKIVIRPSSLMGEANLLGCAARVFQAQGCHCEGA